MTELRSRFLSGAGFLGVGAASSMLTQILLLAPTIHLAGLDVLGEWSMILALLGLLSVVDTGLQTAASRYGADCVARDALGAARGIFGAGIALAFTWVLLVTGGLALVQWLPVSGWNQASSSRILVWVPAILLLQMLAGQARAVCIGIGLSRSVGILETVANGLLLVATPIALIASPSVEALAGSFGVRAGFLLVANGLVLTGATKAQARGDGSGAGLQEIVKFAVPVALSAVMGVSYFSAPRLILGWMAGVDAVGLFEVASRFAFATLFVVQPVLANALPAMTLVRGDSERSVRISTELRGGVVVLVSVVEGGTIVLGVAAVSTVLAQPGTPVVLVVGMLGLAYGVIALTGVATTYLRSVRMQWIEFRSLALGVVVLLVLLVGGMGRSLAGVTSALLATSALYFVVLRISMVFSGGREYAPHWGDLIIPFCSAAIAVGLIAALKAGDKQLTVGLGVFLAASTCCVLTLAMAFVCDPYRSALRNLFSSARGMILARGKGLQA